MSIELRAHSQLYTTVVEATSDDDEQTFRRLYVRVADRMLSVIVDCAQAAQIAFEGGDAKDERRVVTRRGDQQARNSPLQIVRGGEKNCRRYRRRFSGFNTRIFRRFAATRRSSVHRAAQSGAEKSARLSLVRVNNRLERATDWCRRPDRCRAAHFGGCRILVARREHRIHRTPAASFSAPCPHARLAIKKFAPRANDRNRKCWRFAVVELHQRGCLVDGYALAVGERRWSHQNCTECACAAGGALHCARIGCRPLECLHPKLADGDCCPHCAKKVRCCLRPNLLMNKTVTGCSHSVHSKDGNYDKLRVFK